MTIHSSVPININETQEKNVVYSLKKYIVSKIVLASNSVPLFWNSGNNKRNTFCYGDRTIGMCSISGVNGRGGIPSNKFKPQHLLPQPDLIKNGHQRQQISVVRVCNRISRLYKSVTIIITVCFASNKPIVDFRYYNVQYIILLQR